MADWLRQEIGTGLQKMLVLRLPNTPPEDTILGVAEVWLAVMQSRNIQWVEHLDRIRVQRAFTALLGTCDRWPAPKMLIDHLGGRDYSAALPGPPPTHEQREQARRILAQARELIKSKSFRR